MIVGVPSVGLICSPQLSQHLKSHRSIHNVSEILFHTCFPCPGHLLQIYVLFSNVTQ